MQHDLNYVERPGGSHTALDGKKNPMQKMSNGFISPQMSEIFTGSANSQAVLFSVPFGGSRCTETYSSTTSQPRSRTQGESIRSQLSCVFGLWLGSAVFPCYGSENAAVTFFAKTSMASTNRSAFCKSKMAGFRGNTVADSRSPAPSAYCPSLPKHHVV